MSDKQAITLLQLQVGLLLEAHCLGLSTAFAADKVHQKGDWSFWICRTKPKKVNSLHTANWGTELMQSKQLLNYNVSKRLPPVKTHAIHMKGADLHWTRVETTRVTESLSSDESSHTQIWSPKFTQIFFNLPFFDCRFGDATAIWTTAQSSTGCSRPTQISQSLLINKQYTRNVTHEQACSSTATDSKGD